MEVVEEVLFEVTRWLLMKLRAMLDTIHHRLGAGQVDRLDMWWQQIAEIHRDIEAVEAVRLML